VAATSAFGQEFTSWKQMHMAVVAAFDLDVRKNFEASIAQRFATSGFQVTTPIGGSKGF